MPHRIRSVPPPKRRRVVTACAECYRRKQKCDRKHPCNICKARDVECTYLDAGEAECLKSHQAAVLDEFNASTTKRKREDDETLLDDALKPSDLSSQTGYSARNDNSLLNLQRSYIMNPLSISTPQKSMMMSYVRDKYFSLIDLLPRGPILKELVKVFFGDANSHVNVLEQFFFDKSFRAWQSFKERPRKEIKLEEIPRELLFFPGVLYQILAVALQYVTLECYAAQLMEATNWSDLENHSLHYTQRGMEVMKLLGRHSPTVTSIQHDLMRSFWLKNSSRGTESWYNLGDAIRQAQDFGLHTKCDVHEGKSIEETLENLWWDELRKRLWVSLFNWDAHMALVLGRPRSINAADCTVEPPIDCNMPISPPTTVPSTMATNQEPSSYTRHVFNNFICHKTHEMLSLGANRAYVKDYGVVRKLHDDVITRLQELAPTARPNNTDYSWDIAFPYLPKQREHINTFANSFLLAIHRPHAATHNESFHAATQASLEVLESQERLFQKISKKHYGTFTLSFYTIDAGLFLLTAILENPDIDDQLRGRIDRALRQSIERLNTIKERSPMAENGAAILQRCFESSQLQRERVSSSSDSGYLSSGPSQTSSMHTNTAMNHSSLDVKQLPAHGHAVSNDYEVIAANDECGIMTNFDLIGNITDFNASFWTDQMSQIVNSNSLPEDDFSWAFLPG